jgi:DNA topoisomerase VI subunit B
VGKIQDEQKTDNFGVITSIVSTKIPFEGSSKEYIGEDAKEIHDVIKRGIQFCAVALSKSNCAPAADAR